jgi:NitT/TauT family transport system ATP-binding protein
MDILDEYYPDAEAERQFATAVDRGRYAELAVGWGVRV